MFLEKVFDVFDFSGGSFGFLEILGAVGAFGLVNFLGIGIGVGVCIGRRYEGICGFFC